MHVGLSGGNHDLQWSILSTSADEIIDCSEISIERLTIETGVTEEKLNKTVNEAELPELSAYFDNTEDYVEKLQLTPGQQTDVRTQAFVNGTQAGMKVALKLWRNRNPAVATFRALLLILFSLSKGDMAVQVCKYLHQKG